MPKILLLIAAGIGVSVSVTVFLLAYHEQAEYHSGAVSQREYQEHLKHEEEWRIFLRHEVNEIRSSLGLKRKGPP